MARWCLIAILFFSLYALVLFHRAVGGGEALFWHDVSIAYLPLRTAAADAIRDGHLPLWESRMGNGFPVLAEGQAGVFYPLRILGYLGLPQYQVYAILIALHCALAAFFTALFCRAFGMRLMPCLTAGMIYGFSGFFVTHVLHIPMIEAAAWLPLALLCVEMWLRQPRKHGWLCGAAMALAMQQLVAMPQIFFYSVLAVVLYMVVATLCRAPRSKSRLEAAPTEEAPPEEARGDSQAGCPTIRPRRVAAGAVAVLAGAILLAAIQIIPTASLVSASARKAATPEKLRELALAPRNLAYFVHPYLLGSYAEGNYFGRDHYYEVCGFVGTIAVLFGIIGAAYGRGRARAFSLILIPLSLFMALANQNPLYELLPSVPGFSFFRGAGRYVLLSSLGFAILAAHGIQALGESKRAVKMGLVLGALGTVVCIAGPIAFRASRDAIVPKLESMAAEGLEGDETAREQAAQKFDFLASRLSPGDPHYLMLLLCLTLPAIACGVCLARACDARWIGELTFALTVVQLFVFAYNYNPTIDAAYYGTKPRLAAHLDAGGCLYIHDQSALQKALKGDRGWATGDLSLYWAKREVLRPNRQVLYGLRSANVFYALAPGRYWTLNRLLSSSLGGKSDPETGLRVSNRPEVLSALGAALICTADRALLPALPIAEDFGTWVARRNEDPAPLAYFAEGLVPCWSAEAALRQMCSPGFRWRRAVVEINEEGVLMTSPGESRPEVTGLTNDRGHLTVRCRVEGRAFLVVREAYDAHFRCLIDGVETPIFRVDYLFRGVQVGPGNHTVEFVYDARDLHVGMLISGIALLGMLLCIVASRRRRNEI